MVHIWNLKINPIENLVLVNVICIWTPCFVGMHDFYIVNAILKLDMRQRDIICN